METKISTNVNQFPSLTWHHLHINHGHLDASVTGVLELKPSAPLPQEITISEFSPKERTGEALELTTQLGADMDSLIDRALLETGSKTKRLTVKKGSNSPAVKFEIDIEDGTQAVQDIEILAEEDSVSSFIFSLSQKQNAKKEGFVCLRIRVLASERANVGIYTVNCLGKNTQVALGLATKCNDQACVELTQVELSAKNIFTGSRNVLAGYKASCLERSAWCANGTDSIDINYIARHEGRQTESNGTFSGVLSGSAKKAWRGTIEFPKGCVDASGEEQEDVLLLSPTVDNKSMPVILCDEEAVEGKHGSSIGKLSPDTLLYLQSRGIDEKTASAMLTKSKINAVARFIPDEDVKEKIRLFLEEMFA